MAQPMNMRCEIQPQGAIDANAGEFWVNNPFEMLNGMHNFSAYETNKFLLNRAGEPFLDLSHQSSVDLDSDSRSAIVADFDRDGDADLLIGSVGGGPIRLFDNRIPRVNRRVQVDLVGVESNRSAIGSRMIAQVGNVQITRDLFPGNGFMGQSPAEMIIGIGQAEKIDRLTVRWPTGRQETFLNIPADCRVSIVEGDSEYQVLAGATEHWQKWDR